jgi:hypothetical protein
MLKLITKSARVVLLLTTAFHAEAEMAKTRVATTGETAIHDEIVDGLPSEPALRPVLRPVLPDFKVKSSVIRRMEVEESPEMPGLRAPKGRIKVTVQWVENPGLPDPQPPLSAPPPAGYPGQARTAAIQAEEQGAQLILVSATVYDHARSYLRCYFSGGTGNEIGAWSNLDFNHFIGFSSYQVKGADGKLREYSFLMGIGDAETKVSGERLAKNGDTHELPEVPSLPDLATKGPAFIITDGAPADKLSVELIQSMHDLYRVEGRRMEAAYHRRIAAYEERKNYLLENPPVPKDVIIRFWKRPPTPRQAVTDSGGAR